MHENIFSLSQQIAKWENAAYKKEFNAMLSCVRLQLPRHHGGQSPELRCKLHDLRQKSNSLDYEASPSSKILIRDNDLRKITPAQNGSS